MGENEIHAGGNTNTPAKSRRYVFTINNYLKDDREQLEQKFKGLNAKYIMAYEVGKLGTPHIQGYIEFKNPRCFSGVKNIMPRAHIEVAKSSRSDNMVYCEKDDDFVTNIYDMHVTKINVIKSYENVKWTWWQQMVIDIVDLREYNRYIWWYYDYIGNTGKSFLCKYLFCKYKCLIGTGKKTDIFNSLLTYQTEYGELPDVIICDIPRHDLDFINWGALEQIKNGLLYSGKYEGGTILYENCPMVICFANKPPDMEKMSKDRWMVYDVNARNHNRN